MPPEGLADLVTGTRLFDAQRASSLVLDVSAATLSVEKVGIPQRPRVQRDRLCQAGSPHPRRRSRGSRPVRADLDVFLDRL